MRVKPTGTQHKFMQRHGSNRSVRFEAATPAHESVQKSMRSYMRLEQINPQCERLTSRESEIASTFKMLPNSALCQDQLEHTRTSYKWSWAPSSQSWMTVSVLACKRSALVLEKKRSGSIARGRHGKGELNMLK